MENLFYFCFFLIFGIIFIVNQIYFIAIIDLLNAGKYLERLLEEEER